MGFARFKIGVWGFKTTHKSWHFVIKSARRLRLGSVWMEGGVSNPVPVSPAGPILMTSVPRDTTGKVCTSFWYWLFIFILGNLSNGIIGILIFECETIPYIQRVNCGVVGISKPFAFVYPSSCWEHPYKYLDRRHEDSQTDRQTTITQRPLCFLRHYVGPFT